MRFSVFVIEPEGYRYTHFLYDTCKYLCYGIEAAGYDCCILRNKLSSDRCNIIVGAHNLTDTAIMEQIRHTGKYILLQSEIVTNNSVNEWPARKSFSKVFLPLMRNAQVVWDGIESNIEQLKKLGIHAEFLRFGYHPQMEEIVHKKNKDIDFLFCGSITPHREKLLRSLIARGYKVVTMFDDAAMYRNDLIARARINLAPNQGPGINHLGIGRVLYLLNNKAMVVVERCHDQKMYEHCFPSADTDQWVDMCLETLHRPDLQDMTDKYYERFKKIRMVDLIAPLLEKFIANNTSHRKPAEKTGQADIRLDASSALTSPPLPTPVFKEESEQGLTSIIIVTHNRLDQTKKCVKSIRKHTPEAYEIIFVDNGSTDGTVKWLQTQVRENKNCHLIENKENVGITRGRNQGIHLSRGEYIVLMDNDVSVGGDWLNLLLQCLRNGPEAGLAGPMSNNVRGPQHITDEYYQIADLIDKNAEAFKEQFHHRRIPCRNLAGFCMLFKRTLAEEIGLLDERFGTDQFEAEDFCLRAALHGYKNYIAGDVFVYHHGNKRPPGDRKTLQEKWKLSMASLEGKKLAVLKTTELADAFYSKKNMDQAIEALINCIKLTPDEGEIYYKLACFFIESKRFSEAWDVIGTMPDAAKHNLKGLEYAGYAKEGLGLDSDAAEYVKKMLAVKDQYAPALNLRGVLAYKSGNKEEAAAHFRMAMEADPGYGEAYANLGVFCWSMDRKDEATAFLKKGFILSPTVPDVSSLYYSVVSSSGIFGDAEADYRIASKLYPGNKNLAFLSIDILLRQAKFNEAFSQIQDVLDSYGLDDDILNEALAIREKIGPLQIEKTSKKGTLSLCMIVKNEEKYLLQCLKSVRSIVDEIIMVDTGSTDRTTSIAKLFGAKLFDFPWTGDFAAARNYSLEQATGNWILILDADEVLSPLDFQELKQIIHKKTSSPAAYSIATRNYVRNIGIIGWTPNSGDYPEEAGNGWVKSVKVRLLTRNKNAYFSNPVHEILENSLKKAKIPIFASQIIVHHYGKLEEKKDLQKGEDYYLLGKIKCENDPSNMRYLMELARQAQVLRKNEEAAELWLRLISLFQKADPDSQDYKDIVHMCQGEPLAEMYAQLAMVYLLLDRFEEALETARKTMESKSRLKEYVHVYALCEIIAGSRDKAHYELDNLLKTMPEYPPAVLLKTILFCLEGEKEKTREYLQWLQQKGIYLPPLMNKYATQFHKHEKRNEALLILHATTDNKLNDLETDKLLKEFQK